MNRIWSGMIAASIVYAFFHGTMQPLSEEILNASKEAVNLCIYMAGVTGVWTGMMKAAESAGLLKKLERLLMPLICFLFPKIKDQQTKEYIAVNMAANVLGLGWAATPAGLKAMESLYKLNHKTCTASAEMCTLLIINISSLQLIPVNIIAYRGQFGSVNPTAVVGPGIVATAVSTGVAVIFCKVMQTVLR